MSLYIAGMCNSNGMGWTSCFESTSAISLPVLCEVLIAIDRVVATCVLVLLTWWCLLLFIYSFYRFIVCYAMAIQFYFQLSAVFAVYCFGIFVRCSSAMNVHWISSVIVFIWRWFSCYRFLFCLACALAYWFLFLLLALFIPIIWLYSQKAGSRCWTCLALRRSRWRSSHCSVSRAAIWHAHVICLLLFIPFVVNTGVFASSIPVFIYASIYISLFALACFLSMSVLL